MVCVFQNQLSLSIWYVEKIIEMNLSKLELNAAEEEKLELCLGYTREVKRKLSG